MTRRTPAVLLAVLTVFLVAPAPLFGDPSPTAPTAPITARTSTPTPTTNVYGLPAESHDSLELYPRRPGAKYEESEARAAEAGLIGFSLVRVVKWAVVPRSARPAGLVAADRKRYERADLVDGYAPSTTHTAGDLLHVVMHVKGAASADPLICAATLAVDGSVLVPYARATPSRASAPSTSARDPDKLIDVDVDLYFPIGAHRGRVFVTCDSTLFASLASPGLFGLGSRPVWGLDV